MKRKPKEKINIDLSLLPEDAIIRLPDVLRIYPISKSRWWLGISKGELPKPIRLGSRARGWRLGTILDLNRSKAA